MAQEIRVEAPAKVNLHLEIGPRRADGFHDLSSLFQIISLADSVHIRSLKDTNTCSISGDFSCPPEKNLAYRARELFRKETGINTGVEIAIDKRIPEGAGLGGGSSDAAATLKGLNRLFGAGLSAETLAEMGSRLGSDIPFFCLSPLAAVEGRGERIIPLEQPECRPLVIVIPDFSISTAQAYGWLDEAEAGKGQGFKYDAGEMNRLYCKTADTWPFFNSFTPVLEQRFPRIGATLAFLRKSGALFAEVSGSGSAMFGVFADSAAAERCRSELNREKELKQVLIIELLARFPTSILQ